MAEEMTGKKPEGKLENINVAAGKKDAPEQGEVAGHMSPGAFYFCWNDHARNFVPYGWTAFYCFNCGALNVV